MRASMRAYISKPDSGTHEIKLIIVDAFDAEYPPPPVTYYTDSDYIDHWIYSPECCPKVVESFFSPLEEQ